MTAESSLLSTAAAQTKEMLQDNTSIAQAGMVYLVKIQATWMRKLRIVRVPIKVRLILKTTRQDRRTGQCCWIRIIQK